MKNTISKKDILKAINTEPLAYGEWVKMDKDGSGWPTIISSDKNCSVCAVGSILRQAGLTNKRIHDFGFEMLHHGSVTANDPYLEHSLKDALKNKEYLHALSIKFENQANKIGVNKRTRSALTKFIEVNFPNRIKLDPKF